ncbi:MAG: 5'/3'-nucleotidase SurE [Thermovirgaceae bacterium]
MKILVTNDDGVFAPGIVTLASYLFENGFEPFVVAPDRERSSVGHAITLTRPLRLWKITGGQYPEGLVAHACDGTPSDCVVLGLEREETGADMVISGINRGPNLGDDLTYSGTVSAAVEGHFLGKPAIAVSLDCRPEDEIHHYKTAAEAVLRILGKIPALPLQENPLLNINVPNLPRHEIKGLRVTKKGFRYYSEKVTRLLDPKGNEFFWVCGNPEDRLDEGSDVTAVSEGYISVTPIHMDLTDYTEMDTLRREGFEKLGF